MSEEVDEYEEYEVQMKPNSDVNVKYPEDVVIIPIMNSPIFPGMIAPIILSEEKFTSELDRRILKSGYVALNLVKYINDENDENDEEEEEETISEEDYEEEDEREIYASNIYKVGVLCKVVKKLKL